VKSLRVTDDSLNVAHMPAFLDLALMISGLILASLVYFLWRRNLDLRRSERELRRSLSQTQSELGVIRIEIDRKALDNANLLQNVRHDLKTPITSILGFSALLSETQLDARSQRFCQAIQMGARQLLQVAESIGTHAQSVEGDRDATRH
jgi:signal transduction histidine kinase